MAVIYLTVRNLDDMTVSLPRLVQRSVVFQPQFIAHREADFAALQFGQTKPGDAFLVQPQIPTDGDVGLCL